MPSDPPFDVEIRRAIAVDQLRWPEPGTAGHDSGLGCNREYGDLRGCSWAQAARVWDLESELIERLSAASDKDQEYDVILDELYEHDEGLFGLDIGVASSVIALSAAGCVPFSSCNAGAYGGHHYERHPLVAFYARRYHVDLLLHCAEAAGAGLENTHYGGLVLYADDIDKVRKFAEALRDMKGQFRSARKAGAVRKDEPATATKPAPRQLKLPFN